MTKKIIKEKLYYFDNVVVNFKIPLEELIEIMPVDKLTKNCKPSMGGKIIQPASNTGRFWGYQSKIDATVCNDKFIRILKNTLKHHSLDEFLTKKEISCEYFPKIEKWEYAQELQRRFDSKIYRKWGRDKGFPYRSKIGNSHTTYLATEIGKPSNNFNRSYVWDSKILQLANINKPCFRVEFTLSGAAIIKRVLKINSIHDLKSAKYHYRQLFKRYFKVPEIDKKKVMEIASEYYPGIREAYKIGKEINSYPKLKKWLNQIKDDISRKNYSRRYRLRDIEKKILLNNDNYYFV